MKKLLQTYSKTDEAIKKDMLEKGHSTPCKKGCSNCCHNADIPISEPEIIVIIEHIKKNISNEMLGRIEAELEKSDENSDKCTFLTNTECGIYTVRPLACRTFFMLGETCKIGEDISENRINDLYRPPKEEIFKATLPLLEMYGYKTRARQLEAFKNGFLMEQTFPMHCYDWKENLLPIIKRKKG